MSAPTTTRPPRAAAGPERSHRPGHRADIQGLRAVAVLVVIAAHAGLVPLTGGFVGVDVFFVISGFLISRLLFLEASRRGRISLSGFYARRARRILPAATLVTVATVVASTWLLGVVDAIEVVYDAAWATVFLANVRFADRAVDYFAQDAGLSPMQHYWSLSVEEQFYLVWPLLLVACLALSRWRGGPGRLPRLPLLGALALLTAGSFGYASVLVAREPASAYFSTPARIWELGVGAMLALVAPALAGRLDRRLRGLLAMTGLGLIAVSCLEFGPATLFPGSAALLPVTGAALAILAGSHPRDRQPLAVRLVGARPMRVIGDWSYSLYLWHWPVLVLARQYLARPLTPLETGAALLAIFALSGATYHLVESPFRRGMRISVPRTLVLYPVSLALVAATCAGAWYATQWRGGERGDNPAVTLADYGPTRSAEGARSGPAARERISVSAEVALVQASALAAREGRAVPSDLTPDLVDIAGDVADVGGCNYAEDVRSLCPRGDPDGDRTMIVLGNSHGRMWIPAIDAIGQRAGVRVYYLVLPQCVPGMTLALPGTGDAWENCLSFNAWAKKQVARLQPDLVLVATAGPPEWAVETGRISERALDQAYADNLRSLFAEVTRSTERMVLVRDVPQPGADPVDCLASRRADLGRCAFEPDGRAEQHAEISVRVARQAGADVVDTRSWFCWSGTCPAVIGSTITFRDGNHITTAYAAELAEPLGRALGLWPTG